MSKLADRIKRASHLEPAPLGFAAAMARPKSPTMLLLVRLSGGDAGKAADAVAKGADGVIVEGSKPKDAPEVTGVRADNPDRAAIRALRDSGADFAVLDAASTPAEALLEDKIGFVLEVPEGLDDTRLRLLGDLGLDAAIVAAPPGGMTIAGLLELRRIGSLARTPLLVEADATADSSRLQLLRDAGVAGVVVPASAIGKLGELRDRIAALPARGRRKEEHAEALVPASTSTGHDHDDYDDDDD